MRIRSQGFKLERHQRLVTFISVFRGYRRFSVLLLLTLALNGWFVCLQSWDEVRNNDIIRHSLSSAALSPVSAWGFHLFSFMSWERREGKHRDWWVLMVVSLLCALLLTCLQTSNSTQPAGCFKAPSGQISDIHTQQCALRHELSSLQYEMSLSLEKHHLRAIWEMYSSRPQIY